jgi:hypothetical protein
MAERCVVPGRLAGATKGSYSESVSRVAGYWNMLIAWFGCKFLDVARLWQRSVRQIGRHAMPHERQSIAIVDMNEVQYVITWLDRLYWSRPKEDVAYIYIYIYLYIYLYDSICMLYGSDIWIYACR